MHRRFGQQLLWAYSLVLIGVLVVVWMPWLAAGVGILLAAIALAALIGWWWLKRRFGGLIKDLESQMRQAGAPHAVPSDFGAPRARTGSLKDGPVIHIQAEEVVPPRHSAESP